jgi:hypothetical protein
MKKVGKQMALTGFPENLNGDFTCPVQRLASRPAGAPRHPATIVVMPRGTVLRLDKAAHVKYIEVLTGVVWLTETPARADSILSAGDIFQISGGFPIILQALEEAKVRQEFNTG